MDNTIGTSTFEPNKNIYASPTKNKLILDYTSLGQLVLVDENNNILFNS